MQPMSAAALARLNASAIATLLSGPPSAAAALLASAAESGIVEAQAVYGQYLLSGLGVQRDAPGALRWFRQAARADHPMAMNMVGRCHELAWGTTASMEIAVYWYRLSAKAGLDWGMYNLGTALALGRGVTEDRPQAYAWFQRSAALGHGKSSNYLGSFHEDGWSVDIDLDTALHHYLDAAHDGDFRGQYNAARLLAARGRHQEAIAWMQELAHSATPAFAAQVREALPLSPDRVMRHAAWLFVAGPAERGQT